MTSLSSVSLSAIPPKAPQQTRQSLELWECARASLPAHVQSLIDFHQIDRRRILDDVLQLAEAKRMQCIKSRWKITRGNGEVIVLRDVFEKVVSFVRTFRDIGDVAVQYDPGHASLPWAGVRFVLQIVISETTAFAALMDGLEKVTDCISRYAIIEVLYLGERSAPANRLAGSLIAVYAAILTFLGKSIKFFAHGTAKRLVKNTFGGTDRMISELTATITQRQMQVEQDTILVQGLRQLNIVDATTSGVTQSVQTGVGAITAEVQRAGEATMAVNLRTHAEVEKLLRLVEKLSTPSHRSAVPLRDITDDRSEKERLELLKWVSTIPYEQHHNNVRKNRISTTGQWLFAKQEFKQWRLSSSSSILWVHGIPGSGKTVLTSALIDRILDEESVSDTSPPMAIFYCSRNPAEPERANPREIFASIARQLSGQDCSLPIRLPLKYAFEKIKKKGFEARKMDVDETVALITALDNDNPSIIVIDGLDECDSSLRYELLEGLEQILQSSVNVVKVFVTSRPDHDIVCRLKNVPNIYIRAADNEDDIRTFVEVEISQAIDNKRLLHGDVSLDLKARLNQSLNDGAQGMFRWVSLQLQNLCNPQRIKIEADVISELGKMPQTLADTYDVIYDQVLRSSVVSRQLAQRALQWMMVAQRQLKPSELAMALSVIHANGTAEVTPDEIPALTCNLIVIDEFLDTVRFAHASVREYLESRSEFFQDECHLYVGLACLQNYGDQHYRDFDTGLSINDSWPTRSESLSSYASLYWPVHASQINEPQLRAKVIEVLNCVVLNRLVPSRSFILWRKSISKAVRDFDVIDDSLHSAIQACVTPFHTSCVFGFHELLRCSQEEVKTHNYTYEDSTKVSPYHGLNGLHMAIARGHYGVVETILKVGADVRQTTLTGCTPVYIAVRANEKNLIPLLTRCGADPNWAVPLTNLTQDGHSPEPIDDHAERRETLSPWRGGHSTVMGHRNLDGRTTSAIDEERETPMHHAAARGFQECIIELVKNGANIDATTNTSVTPLVTALTNMKYSTLQLLLDSGASVNKTLLYGRTALHLAAAMGKVTAVRILMSSGADPHQRDWLGSTPCHLAQRYRHDNVVKLLPTSSRSQVPSTVDTGGEHDSDDEPFDPIFQEAAAFEQQLSIVISEWDHLRHRSIKRKPVPKTMFPPVVAHAGAPNTSIRRKPLPK